MKPYQSIPIVECGEELMAIPHIFTFASPHEYVALGAPYGDLSPYYLREGVIGRLITSLEHLHKTHPRWQIKIFDAYRPVAVQQFMVDFTKRQIAEQRGWDWHNLSLPQEHELAEIVSQFWASPSLNPATPPPHSTGAAVDVTLVDENNCDIPMGSAIDEISDRSFPNYYEKYAIAPEVEFHTNRQILFECMTASGFQRHPNEWWHFSFGDQMWVWLNMESPKNQTAIQTARYGRFGVVNTEY